MFRGNVLSQSSRHYVAPKRLCLLVSPRGAVFKKTNYIFTTVKISDRMSSRSIDGPCAEVRINYTLVRCKRRCFSMGWERLHGNVHGLWCRTKRLFFFFASYVCYSVCRQHINVWRNHPHRAFSNCANSFTNVHSASAVANAIICNTFPPLLLPRSARCLPSPPFPFPSHKPRQIIKFFVLSASPTFYIFPYNHLDLFIYKYTEHVICSVWINFSAIFLSHIENDLQHSSVHINVMYVLYLLWIVYLCL